MYKKEVVGRITLFLALLNDETLQICFHLVSSREKLRDGEKMTFVMTHVIQVC